MRERGRARQERRGTEPQTRRDQPEPGPAGPQQRGTEPQRRRDQPGPSGPQRRRDEGAVADGLWMPSGRASSAPPGFRHRMPPGRAGHEPGRGARGPGRPAPSLSPGEIVDAAIAVADAEGSNAVSMRRIAQVLRAGTMSLYWHVANKEHLLDLMLDALIAEVSVPEPSGDWRADLGTLARNNRSMLLRHLWMMDFVGGRPPLGPNTLLNLDRSLALLDDLGLGVGTAVDILSTVLTYVMGAVLREMRERRVQRDQEQAGIDLADWEPARAAWRDRLDADGRFTRVVRFLDERIDPDAEQTRDERFEFGLDCVLDGIAARIAAPLSG